MDEFPRMIAAPVVYHATRKTAVAAWHEQRRAPGGTIHRRFPSADARIMGIHLRSVTRRASGDAPTACRRAAATEER